MLDFVVVIQQTMVSCGVLWVKECECDWAVEICSKMTAINEVCISRGQRTEKAFNMTARLKDYSQIRRQRTSCSNAALYGGGEPIGTLMSDCVSCVYVRALDIGMAASGGKEDDVYPIGGAEMNCDDAFESVLRRPIGLAEEPLLSLMLALRERELFGVDIFFPVSFSSCCE